MQRATMLPALAAWTLLLAALLGGVALVQAAAGTTPDAGTTPAFDFTLVRAVVGAGGAHAAGAGYALDATAGQPAAGPAAGPQWGLTAGFWGVPLPPLPPGHTVYLPLVLR